MAIQATKILRVSVSLLGDWDVASQIFFKNEQDGRSVIPKQTLDLLRQDYFDIEGYMLELSLETS